MKSLFDLLRCPKHPVAGPLIQSEILICRQCGHGYPVIDGIPDFVIPDNFTISEAQQWDEHSPRYNEKRQNEFTYMASIEAAVHALAANQKDLILDAACGTGLTTKAYSKQGMKIIALDLSFESLRHMRNTMKTSDILYIRGDLRVLPFASGIFDKVLCANAIQHLPDESIRRQCVHELARVAKSGGRVIVTVHNWSKRQRRMGWTKEGSAGSLSGPVRYIWRIEADEFRNLLASELNVESLRGAGLPLPYRLKLSPLSRRLERLLRRFPASVRWGNMLVGVGRTPLH